MEAQVITKILDTEKVADKIVNDAKQKANTIIGEADEKASKDFEEKINKVRKENRKLLDDREVVLEKELKKIEGEEVVSGSTEAEVERLASAIVKYITTTVLE